MILAGQLLMHDRLGRCHLQPGMLRIQDGTIAEVVRGQLPASADAGDDQTIISPGFIDAHLHLPQFSIIGAHGLPLLQWLSDVTFAAEGKWSDASFADGCTASAVQQLLSVGTTGIAAYASVHHDAAQAAIKRVRDLGMRALVGQVLMDRAAPGFLCRPAARLLEEARHLGEQFPPGQRVSAAITPRFAVSCSEQLLHGAGEIAAELQCMVQTHLAETTAECQRVQADFGGRGYVQVYDETGLLGARSIFGHGVHLDQTDRDRLRESESVIAHCPTANSFLRSGAMDREALEKSRVRVALGSDIGAGYERCMVRVARAMIETAAAIGNRWPTAAEAWHTITAGNAEALGWPDAGRLQVGAPADVVMIRPTIAVGENGIDPLSQLMFAWDDRWIERTLLRGKVVYGSPVRA